MSGLLRGLKFGFGPVGDFVYKAGGSVADTVKGVFGKLSGGTSGANERLGKLMMQAKGWSADQWPALRALWMGESGWRTGALNKSSGAYGIPQALPASKMASAGKDWKSSAATQIKWGLGYIQGRYGSPGAAYNAWLGRSPHWYAKGTGGAAPGLAWVGEKGPELVNFRGGETVWSNTDSRALAKANGIKLPGYASGTILNAADRVRRDRQRVEDAKDNVARAKRRHKGVAAAEKQLKAAEKALQTAEISLKNAKRSAKTSIANTIATGLLKTLEKGTASAIASAVKSLTTKLLNAGYDKLAKSILKTGDKLEKLANKRDKIQQQIAAANQYAADQTSNINSFLSVSGTSATSVSGLISQMKGQQKTAGDFDKLVTSLRNRGASKGLLAQLAEAGPGSQLATILGNRNVTTADISHLNSLVKSGSQLATSFGKSMADLMYDSGKHAGEGFLAGLKAQEKDLQSEMDKLAKGLVKAIKKALKIKSPSAVMRDEVGWQVGAGMVAGMDAHRPHIAAAARRMADTARTAKIQAATAVGSVSGSGTASAQMPKVEVHVHVDDPTLRDLIRVEVKPLIRASEQKQAHEAKVGRR
jgi:hypothetical protein